MTRRWIPFANRAAVMLVPSVTAPNRSMQSLRVFIIALSVAMTATVFQAMGAAAAAATESPTTPSPSGSQVPDAGVEDLHKALDRLITDVQRKIDDEIDVTAGAFWEVYAVERKRWAADFAGLFLAGWNFALSTVDQAKNLFTIEQGIPKVAASGNSLSLGAYIASLGALQQAGENYVLAVSGPAYVDGIKQMYERAAKENIETDFEDVIKTSLQRLVWVRAPAAEQHHGIPVVTNGSAVLLGRLRQRVAELKTTFPADGSADRDAAQDALAILERLHTNMLESQAGSVEVAIPGRQPGTADETLAMGTIAELLKEHAKLFGQYDTALRQKQITVTVDSAKSAGNAAKLYLTFDFGAGATRVQSSILAADSLAWKATKHTFKTDVRRLVAEIPQHMVFSLSSEFSNTWHVADAALSEVEELLRKARLAQGTLEEEVPTDQKSATRPAVQPSPPIHDCDRLAAHPYDNDRIGDGVNFVIIDAERALEACKQAVAAFPKVPRFQYQLARALQKAGHFDEAQRLYEEGDNAGYPAAQVGLAFMYARVGGTPETYAGLPKDYGKAVELWLKAAEAGHVGAQAQLGWMYETGTGVNKDLEAAAIWYTKAAAKGDTYSKEGLERVRPGQQAAMREPAETSESSREAARDSGEPPSTPPAGNGGASPFDGVWYIDVERNQESFKPLLINERIGLYIVNGTLFEMSNRDSNSLKLTSGRTGNLTVNLSIVSENKLQLAGNIPSYYWPRDEIQYLSKSNESINLKNLVNTLPADFIISFLSISFGHTVAIKIYGPFDFSNEPISLNLSNTIAHIFNICLKQAVIYVQLYDSKNELMFGVSFKNGNVLQVNNIALLIKQKNEALQMKRQADELAANRRREPLNLFVRSVNVTQYVYLQTLYANPFEYEGKTVVVEAHFEQMLSKSEALFRNFTDFSLGRPFVIVSNIPPGRFTRNVTVLLAARVLGNKEMKTAAGGEEMLPHLEYIDAYWGEYTKDDLTWAMGQLKAR